MAKTESTELYLQASVPDLEVIDTYKELMAASTGQDSAYLKAKETLNDIISDNSMTGTEKSAIVAQTISAIATSITQSAMQTALAIAKENRDGKYALTKVMEDTKLVKEQTDKVAAENANLTAQHDKIQEEIDLLQTQDAEIIANGIADRAIKAEQALNEADKRLSTAKAREVQEAQKKLYERQYAGFDDNKKIKAFEAQMNTWALLYSSGMIEGATPASVISDANLTSAYSNLTTDTP